MPGVDLTLLFVFLLVKYALPSAIATAAGRPSPRAQDKLAREQAAALEAHKRRLANLPPPPPTLREAIRARLATWIAPDSAEDDAEDDTKGTTSRPAKPRKGSAQHGPWMRAVIALRAELREMAKDAADEAERRATQWRFDRQNRRRQRAGQSPIVIQVYPCLGDACLGRNVVDHPTRLCPECTRAAAPPAPAPPRPAPVPGHEPEPATAARCSPPHPCSSCYQGDWCIRGAAPPPDPPAPAAPELPSWCAEPPTTDPPPVPGPPPADPETPEPAQGPGTATEGDPAMRSPSTAVTPAAPDGSWHNCVGLPGHPAVLDTPGEPCPHCEVDDPPTAASTPTSTNQPKENTVPQPTQTSNVKVHIDPNARDASGALRCAAASAMFVEGMRKEVGKLANNAARGLRGEVPAVRAIRAAEADIAATLGRFDALVTEHMGHKLTQDELAQDVNLLHAAIGYLDAERRI